MSAVMRQFTRLLPPGGFDGVLAARRSRGPRPCRRRKLPGRSGQLPRRQRDFYSSEAVGPGRTGTA